MGTQLNQGLIKGKAGSASYFPIPFTTDEKNNPCFYTGDTCDFNTWHIKRRTHELSNGEVIWDLSGGVAEWVRENFKKTTNNYSPDMYMSLITSSSYPNKHGDPMMKSLYVEGERFHFGKTVKGLFGPAGDYAGLTTTPYGGLGHADFVGSSSSGNASTTIYRGGHHQFPPLSRSTPTEHGIFSIGRTRYGTQSFIGYRCVFNPEPTKSLCKEPLHLGSWSWSWLFRICRRQVSL